MKKEKQYIIRKYVMAKSVSEALRKEQNIKADEAWIDEEWKRENSSLCETIGFKDKQ